MSNVYYVDLPSSIVEYDDNPSFINNQLVSSLTYWVKDHMDMINVLNMGEGDYFFYTFNQGCDYDKSKLGILIRFGFISDKEKSEKGLVKVTKVNGVKVCQK